MWGEGKVPTISAKAATRHERGSGKESLICNLPESKRPAEWTEIIANDVNQVNICRMALREWSTNHER